MGITIKNLESDSVLNKHHMTIVSSSTLATVAGILPAPGRVNSVYIGATAALSQTYVTIHVNGTSQVEFTFSSVDADGVSKLSADAPYISGGSLIEISVCATKAFAAPIIVAEFKYEKAIK